MAIITVDGLTKTYGAQRGVNDVDLSVPEGSVYALVGPNGSGKSTIINVLAGLVRPTSGRAEVFGRDVSSDSVAINERTGVVHGDFGTYDRLTGREHVAFVIRSRGTDEDPDDLLDRLGLASVSDSPIGSYSGGMVKRLGIAMALVGDPDLLLLDEPFRALDHDSAETIEGIVRDRKARGKTVVFSTHQVHYVERLCDAACLLADGSVVADGSLADLCGEEARVVLDLDDPSDAILERVAEIEGVADVRRRDGSPTVVVRGSLDVCGDLFAAVDGGRPGNVHLSRPSLSNAIEREFGGSKP